MANRCPYNCSNGKVFNVAIKQFVDCPHCSAKRREEVKENKGEEEGKTLCEQLHLQKSLVGMQFLMDAILPEYARTYIIPDSIPAVEKVLKEITDQAILGEVPDHSICFNLGKRANVDAFAYQYIMKAYKAGISVAPYVTAREIYQLRNKENNEWLTGIEQTEGYSDYINKDLCVVQIDAGATKAEINAVGGLMQLRARQNKPTIILTLNYTKTLFDFVYDATSDEKLYHLAQLIEVKYQGVDNSISTSFSSYNSPVLPDEEITFKQFREMIPR